MSVVERLQEQVNSLASDKERSLLGCEEARRDADRAQEEVRELRARAMQLESEAAERSEQLLRTKKKAAGELQAAADEVEALKRELLAERERTRLLTASSRHLEAQLADKAGETEDATKRAMDLVNRTQVAASNTLQREESKHVAMMEKFTIECKRLKAEAKEFKARLQASEIFNAELKKKLELSTYSNSNEKESQYELQRKNEELSRALQDARVNNARYEERLKDVKAYKAAVKQLKAEMRERDDETMSLRDENNALRSEIDALVNRNAESIDHIRKVCHDKIEQEHLLGQKLRAEVKDARSAIMSMHAAVADRNDLLNSLENRLEEMGDLESKATRTQAVNKAIYQSVVKPRTTSAGVGLYQALDAKGKNKGIENALLNKADGERVLERQKRKESKERKRHQPHQHDTFETNGGKSWTVS